MLGSRRQCRKREKITKNTNLAPAKSELPSIVPDEGNALTGIAGLRAEITRLDPSHN